jgi:pimeloyl-ACP methyl ester carboxylesterase
MDYWAPSFVDALAAHHTVIVFDNAGVGDTAALPSPLSIPAMAGQTSALISALRLGRPAVLGYSMGGMVAQALAVLFPPDQAAAAQAYLLGILQYPGLYGAGQAAKTQQAAAIQQWMAGRDPAGRRLSRIRARTLVADGTLDQLDPVPNDWLLATGIPRARLLLYPDAGHAFLFQCTTWFVPAVERFLR